MTYWVLEWNYKSKVLSEGCNDNSYQLPMDMFHTDAQPLSGCLTGRPDN